MRLSESSVILVLVLITKRFYAILKFILVLVLVNKNNTATGQVRPGNGGSCDDHFYTFIFF